MAENTFLNYLIGFILFTLFGIMILNAVYSTGATYGKDMTNFGGFNYSGFNNTANTFSGIAEDKQTVFGESSIFNPIAGIVSTGIFSIANDLINIVLAPFRLLSSVAINILGIPVIVVNVLLAVLIISILFSIWALIKIGQ